MREISKQLGFSVGTGHRTLSSVEKKRSDIAEGRKEGWIMLNDDEQRTKYTNELLEALEYWVIWFVIVRLRTISSSNEIEMVPLFKIQQHVNLFVFRR
jgi:hypothetical protein